MTYLHAQALCYQFVDGERLFENLSFTINAGITGLVGRNGCGKSLLAKVLVGKIKSTEGTVTANCSTGYLSQQTLNDKELSICIAEFLNVAEKLVALTNIENGSCDMHDFDLVGDDWDFHEQFRAQLIRLQLPEDPFTACHTLSGGQLRRLQLWKLFQAEYQLLILDEPSNHLDKHGREWLIEMLHGFSGAILLISHDRQLLRQTSTILELSSLGIKQYAGQYDDYAHHKSCELVALNRKLNDVEKQRRSKIKQHQENREKAQQREAKGKRLRSSGSHGKMALDAKKGGAESSASARNSQHENQIALVDQQFNTLKKEQEQLTAQSLSISSAQQGAKRLLDIINLRLPYGVIEPITLAVNQGDKVHIVGANGCGKSTLMKAIVNSQDQRQIDCFLHSRCIYLDQHFSLLNETMTLLDNLLFYCEHYTEGEVRTLLATIGFRGDRVFKSTEKLSGGEKMRLAMLIVAHQQGNTLLLLDEPDNHLDLDGKQLLASALNNYQGSYILVSHDDDFVAEAGVNCHYQLTG